ncbi:MAG: energy transducer TonB [Pyrinomonadaceae bacterium]
MKKMVLLSSVVNGTLVSVESYQASKDSLDDLEEGDKRFLKNLHTSKQKLHDYTAQSLSGDRDAGFIQRRYLYSKNFVYIVTAAARDAQTPEMKRFLDSLQFTPGVAHDAGQDIKTFSAVPATKLEIDLHPPVRSVPAQAKTEDLTGSDKLVILLKPLPTFTRAARGSNTSGDILLSVTFGPAGLVTKISVHKSIGEGLLRQAVFAALRMKYLPPISGANALQPMTNRVEYSFSIY